MLVDNKQLGSRLKQLIRINRLIPREYRAHEAKLMVSKWPAYRFMSPLKATKVFHDEYVKAYKAYLRANVDLTYSENTKVGAKVSFRKSSAHLTQLWAARQQADDLGLPYPDYLSFAFNFASRRERKRAPQPNQLAPNPKTQDAWYGKLAEFWTADRHGMALTRMEPMAQYAVENDEGLPAQKQFRAELVESIGERGGLLDIPIGKYVLVLRYLRKEDCAPLGEGAVALALERLHHDPDPSLSSPYDYGKVERGALYQGCYGLLGIADGDPVCALCPHHGKCVTARKRVSEQVVAQTGSAEPLEDAKRAKNRERVARHRARQKKKARSEARPKRAGPGAPPAV